VVKLALTKIYQELQEETLQELTLKAKIDKAEKAFRQLISIAPTQVRLLVMYRY
jgi:hypothetical protein